MVLRQGGIRRWYCRISRGWPGRQAGGLGRQGRTMGGAGGAAAREAGGRGNGPSRRVGRALCHAPARQAPAPAVLARTQRCRSRAGAQCPSRCCWWQTGGSSGRSTCQEVGRGRMPLKSACVAGPRPAGRPWCCTPQQAPVEGGSHGDRPAAELREHLRVATAARVAGTRCAAGRQVRRSGDAAGHPPAQRCCRACCSCGGRAACSNKEIPHSACSSSAHLCLDLAASEGRRLYTGAGGAVRVVGVHDGGDCGGGREEAAAPCGTVPVGATASPPGVATPAHRAASPAGGTSLPAATGWACAHVG